MRFDAVKLVGIALIAATVANAAPPNNDHGVVADLVVAKVAKSSSGKPTFTSARGAEPGDVVEYRVTYRNTNYAPVHSVVGTLTVPVHRLNYLPEGGTQGFLVEASLDGKTFEPVPIKRPVVAEDGRMKMQAISPSEYRYLRWQIGEIPARSSTTVKARMRVNQQQVVLVTNSARSK